MQLFSLNPIDSSLKRTQTAFRNSERLLPRAPRKSRTSSLSLADKLQELHFALLGTMVALQNVSGEIEIKLLLNDLRHQILRFRAIKDAIELSPVASEDLVSRAKEIMITFYDLEGMLRRKSAKSKTKPTRSAIIVAIAEKSRTALALAITRAK